MSGDAPLVTIGIPTYNRADGLARALGSAVEQTHRNLEILVSDNASTDGTEALCRRMMDADPRVRYVRQERNVGATENFNAVMREARGAYLVLVADDDWVDADYVERCVGVLERRPDHAIVAGTAVYHGAVDVPDAPMRLDAESPRTRVLEYFRGVSGNGTFYGVIRRDALDGAPALPNVLAGDWLFVGALAYRGKVETLPETHVHRTAGGTSADLERIVRRLGLPRAQARLPFLAMGWNVLADVGWRSPVYGAEGRLPRLLLGLRAAWSVVRGRPNLWMLLWPIVPWSRRRASTRWIHALYERAAHATGRRG